MQQKYHWIIGIIALVGIISISGYVTHVIQEGTSDKAVYKADKDMCGEIIFSKKLADDFNSAYGMLELEKKDQFSKYCPNNPCYEVELESKKAQEVTDINGNIVNIDLYFITVKDISTGLSVHALSDALDGEGNLYRLEWCPD